MPMDACAMDGGGCWDRFTTRCRLPPRAMLDRPRGSSAFLLFALPAPPDASNSAQAAVCRAALAAGEDGVGGVDATVTVPCRSRVFKDVQAVNAEADHSARWLWIPQRSVRNAVAVTLQLVPRDGRRVEAEALQQRSRRQPLLDAMQQRVAVCVGARVRLPGVGDQPDAESEWKIVSTYPASDFVCVTTSTRVTLTLPEDPQHGAVDVDDEEEGVKAESAPVKDGEALARVPRVGGLERERAALREMIMLPLAASGRHVRDAFGIEFPKGLLLCGPPGVGKTLLVRSVVHECRHREDVDLHLEVINGAEIMTSGIGDAEAALRAIFQHARDHLADATHTTNAASVIFIDELDALCPKRDDRGGSGTSHSRVVAQLLTLMDGVERAGSASKGTGGSANDTVVVVGATNLPNAIDPALRRSGRFDRELFLPPPDAAQRRRIFETHVADMPLALSESSTGVDSASDRSVMLDALAVKAIGYVGADIAALCREALGVASTRRFVEMARDRELAAWWEDWKRRGLSVLESIETLAASGKSVAGQAWQANPVAIPLWFLTKQQPATERQPKANEYFSYLFKDNAVNTTNEHVASEGAEDAASAPAVAAPDHLPDRKKQGGDAERPFLVTLTDFEQAMTVVVASTLRGASGFMKSVDSLGWDSIGGQEETKLALQQALEWPLKFPETFTRLGVQPPRGILLYGPPGCSKSSIVRAAARASGATFLSLPAAAVFSPYFGDAEAAIRQVFRDARRALPAIIFFDEIDVLVAKRAFDGGDGGGDSSSSTAMRILSTLLNEMDGVESADGLLVIGATNVPERIDAALLRPGRFDRVLFVDLPQEPDRLAILEIHARGMPLESDVDLCEIARDSPYCSGAELENICREAALLALRESIEAERVAMRHFREALRGVRPVSSADSMVRYVAFAEAMGHLK